MSTVITKKIVCPDCGKEVETQVWTSVCANDKKVFDRIMDENLFDWKCPFCGKIYEMEYPCLLYDKRNNFLIYYTPGNQNFNPEGVSTHDDYSALDSATKRTVNTQWQLKEKALIFQNGLCDTAIEVVKAGLIRQLEKQSEIKIISARFAYYDKVNERIGLQFFTDDETQPIKKAVKKAVYDFSIKICNKYYNPNVDEFLNIGQKRAVRILEKYQDELADIQLKKTSL